MNPLESQDRPKICPRCGEILLIGASEERGACYHRCESCNFVRCDEGCRTQWCGCLQEALDQYEQGLKESIKEVDILYNQNEVKRFMDRKTMKRKEYYQIQ